MAASSENTLDISTAVKGVKNGGIYYVNLGLVPISVLPGQSLTISFVINNQGGSIISGDTIATAASVAANALGRPEIANGVTIAQQVLSPIFPGFFKSGACNGIVAADRIVLSSSQLQSMPGSGYIFKKEYPGTNSPIFCGSNSLYEVQLSVDPYTPIIVHNPGHPTPAERMGH